jgi:hypothetical protein
MFNAAIIKKKFKLDKRHSKTISSLMSVMLKCKSSNLARLSEGIEEDIKISSIYIKQIALAPISPLLKALKMA